MQTIGVFWGEMPFFNNFFTPSIPVVIVGNKTDLHRERVVSTEEGKRLADTWKASFYEVSARSHEVYGSNMNLVLHGELTPFSFLTS